MQVITPPPRLFSCITLLTLGLALPLPAAAAGPCGVNTSNCMYPTADSTTAVQINKADGTTNVLSVDTTNARVGIGTTSPAARLDVSGGVKLGNESATSCNSTTAGTIRWNGSTFFGCTGTAWIIFASASSLSCTSQYNDHCYTYFSSGLTWSQAKTQCHNLGGYLATITSSAENDFVRLLMPGSGTVWTGLNDIASEGTFVWENGEPVTYTNWRSGEPNDNSAGSSEDCGTIAYSDAKWNDALCTNVYASICEWN